MILAPRVRGRKGEHRDVLAAIKREGFVRVRIDGEILEATELEFELEDRPLQTTPDSRPNTFTSLRSTSRARNKRPSTKQSPSACNALAASMFW